MVTTVIVTGAKSGIGKGLFSVYASRPNTIAIAAIRDGPGTAAAEALQKTPTGKGSKIIVVKYDAGSNTSAEEAVSDLQKNHGISHLDVVIANAGIRKHWGPTSTVTHQEMLEHFQINTLAPLQLYQATTALLNASTQTPKFFVISSLVGTIAAQEYYQMPLVAYGVSKAAINFVVGKIHHEEKRLIAVPVQPGWVQTAMGEGVAESAGKNKSEVPVTIDESVGGLIKIFDTATKEEHSGKLFNQKFELLPW